MKTKIKMIVVAALMLAMVALTGCIQQAVDRIENLQDWFNITEVEVITVSGSLVSLTGAYTVSCYSDGASGSIQEILTIAASIWSQTIYHFADPSCSGAVDVTSYNGKVTTGSTGAISGWNDGAGDTTVPTALDGSALGNNESYTPLTVSVDYASNGNYASQSWFFIVDDTDAFTGLRLYRNHTGNQALSINYFAE